jgi:hypothetical protein
MLIGHREARQTAVAQRHPDLAHGVEVEELRVDLLLRHVDRIERQAVGVEEGEDLVTALDEDGVEVLGRVDAVDERNELLLEFEPLLQDLKVVRLRQEAPCEALRV